MKSTTTDLRIEIIFQIGTPRFLFLESQTDNQFLRLVLTFFGRSRLQCRDNIPQCAQIGFQKLDFFLQFRCTATTTTGSPSSLIQQIFESNDFWLIAIVMFYLGQLQSRRLRTIAGRPNIISPLSTTTLLNSLVTLRVEKTRLLAGPPNPRMVHNCTISLFWPLPVSEGWDNLLSLFLGVWSVCSILYPGVN